MTHNSPGNTLEIGMKSEALEHAGRLLSNPISMSVPYFPYRTTEKSKSHLPQLSVALLWVSESVRQHCRLSHSLSTACWPSSPEHITWHSLSASPKRGQSINLMYMKTIWHGMTEQEWEVGLTEEPGLSLCLHPVITVSCKPLHSTFGMSTLANSTELQGWETLRRIAPPGLSFYRWGNWSSGQVRSWPGTAQASMIILWGFQIRPLIFWSFPLTSHTSVDLRTWGKCQLGNSFYSDGHCHWLTHSHSRVAASIFLLAFHYQIRKRFSGMVSLVGWVADVITTLFSSWAMGLSV